MRSRAHSVFRIVGGRNASGSLKRATYLAMPKLGWEKGLPVKHYYARVRIDPEAPLGRREIPNGPVLTEHPGWLRTRRCVGRLITSLTWAEQARSYR